VHLVNEHSVSSSFADAFANGFRPPGAEFGFQNVKHRNGAKALGLSGLRIEKQEGSEGFGYDLIAENLGFGCKRIGIGRVEIEQAEYLGIDLLEAFDFTRRSKPCATRFTYTVALLDADEIRTGGDDFEFGIGEEAFAIAKHLIDRHLIPRERGASQGGWLFGGMRWERSWGRALRRVKVNR
jgi:hypothetical protein